MSLAATLRAPRSVVRSAHAWRSFATVTDAPAFKIPLINFGKFLNARSPAEKRQTAVEVVTGFKDVGFIYLEQHGIPEATVKNVLAQSAEFFRLPIETKENLRWVDPRANRGYVAIGRERATQSSDPEEIARLRALAPDCKETMEIGRDWDETWKNQWPDESDVPRFKETMLDFYQTCHAIHVHVMRAIALGLDLEEDFFDKLIDQKCHNLRLLSYPPIQTEILKREGQARVAAHSDFGTITLLFQDSVGGLEVLNPHTKRFQPARPIPGTIVVNTGDLLARWSNDVLRSTVHRVSVPPSTELSAPSGGITPLRQSVAFFCNPNFDTVISCLPNCGKDAKYGPVTTEEYIVSRLADTFT